MGSIELFVSNPSAVHVETAAADWVVAGLRPDRLANGIDDTTDFDAVVDDARALPGEFTVVRADADHGRTLHAFRSVTSTYDLYYCRRPGDGSIVAGDHFRDVLSTIPSDERTVPDAVAVDHLLFGTRPTRSYVEEVDRLAHGERLEWAVDSSPATRLVDTISVVDPIDPEAAQRRTDRYLRSVLDDPVGDGDTATMLSGGVDSTLLHTYLDDDASVSGAYDAPEFEFEVEYARSASDVLDADHDLLRFPEGDYLAHLEAAIDASGHPLMLPQDVLMQLTFAESPYLTHVNGGLADGIFGTGTAALAYLARYVGPVRRLVPGATWELEAIKGLAARLERPATDPAGSAMNFRIHADQEQVAAIVGADALDERKRDRLDYTTRRVPGATGSGYAAHMHLGHCIEYFHDVILSTWRQAAHANGTSLLTPFAGRAVLETALAVPPADRYARLAVPSLDRPTRVVSYKHLLRELLADRVPAYDTAKPKGHSQLPSARYLDRGPLSGAFDRYAMPSFVPEPHREAVREGTDEVTWYALNYAIWRDRVLENDDLEPFETTRIVER